MISKKSVANGKKLSVTFALPADAAANNLSVVGDFNNWDESATPMKRGKGGWSASLRLTPGTYRFRYLADGSQWQNDDKADGYEPSEYGSQNCLLVVDSQ